MYKRHNLLLALALIFTTPSLFAQATINEFKPVTQEMLENPAPQDWIHFSRTYDAQRYSPLDQINKNNVSRLQLAWSRGLGISGEIQSIPLVYNGVMYVIGPENVILALDAASGELVWKYEREFTDAQKRRARSKNLAIYENMIINTAPDNYIVALNAVSGEVVWETEVPDGGQHSSGPLVMNDIVVTGRTCQPANRESCFIAGHNVKTGELLWKFQIVPDLDEPGGESWGKSPNHDRNTASTWGLTGSYDPERNLILWGIANPVPNTRGDRHGGDAAGTAFVAPADLYSNSTVALVPETGELKWYYQHLPGDDWDVDYTNERVLVTTRINPDPQHVKWINEDARGETRDVTVMIGEGGGIFVNDRNDGEFLWASPYPFETPHASVSNIDTRTGQTYINKDVVMMKPGENHLVCYWNTVSYWPTAYSPRTNSLYASYVDNCLDMTRSNPEKDQREVRQLGHRPGYEKEKAAGLARINLETGEIMFFNQNPIPTSGGMLATAGGLVFNGDLDRNFRAFDDETGATLWETKVGGPVTMSTITYAVDGRQYVAVYAAFNFASMAVARMTEMTDYITDHFAVYVFALPE